MMVMHMHGTHSSWQEFQAALAEFAEFDTNGSLHGRKGAAAMEFGRLPVQYHESAASADYTVWSYATPIAWHTAAGWVTPEVTYSHTTTIQQTKIFTAISQIES